MNAITAGPVELSVSDLVPVFACLFFQGFWFLFFGRYNGLYEVVQFIITQVVQKFLEIILRVGWVTFQCVSKNKVIRSSKKSGSLDDD